MTSRPLLGPFDPFQPHGPGIAANAEKCFFLSLKLAAHPLNPCDLDLVG